jgi:hypothetical protein
LYSYKFHYTNLDITGGESTFDHLFIYPFLTAVADNLSSAIPWSKAGFKPGETQLSAITKQLELFSIYKEDVHCYLADGIIKLYGLKEIEVLILETSSDFQCKKNQRFILAITRVFLEPLQC